MSCYCGWGPGAGAWLLCHGMSEIFPDTHLECAAAVPLNATDRAARELEEFTLRSHADVDPHAPPAMKASPSVSGDDAGELLHAQYPCCAYHVDVHFAGVCQPSLDAGLALLSALYLSCPA